jgi:hypothetical protein
MWWPAARSDFRSARRSFAGLSLHAAHCQRSGSIAGCHIGRCTESGRSAGSPLYSHLSGNDIVREAAGRLPAGHSGCSFDHRDDFDLGVAVLRLRHAASPQKRTHSEIAHQRGCAVRLNIFTSHIASNQLQQSYSFRMLNILSILHRNTRCFARDFLTFSH